MIVIIPSRYHSKRLPRKPLREIGEKPMIIWVLEQAIKSEADRILVATDHQAILSTVGHYYGRITRQDHQSGTDRVAEVIDDTPDDEIIVNLQGDEPFIDPRTIHQVALLLRNNTADIATLYRRNSNLHDRNIIKVNADGTKFSRDPWNENCYEHVGLYAYTAKTLRTFVSLSPTENELSESLEQLRALDNDFKFAIEEMKHPHPVGGIDTYDDYRKAQRLIKERNLGKHDSTARTNKGRQSRHP